MSVVRFQSFFADVAGGAAFLVAGIGVIIFACIVIIGAVIGSVFIIRYIKKKNANNK